VGRQPHVEFVLGKYRLVFNECLTAARYPGPGTLSGG